MAACLSWILNQAPWGCGETALTYLGHTLTVSLSRCGPHFGRTGIIGRMLKTLFDCMYLLIVVVQNGEIDVIEGVHDNEHNQIAFHTADGLS